MATKAKKTKKKNSTPNYTLVGIIVVVVAFGIFVLTTLDWPSYKQADLIGQWYYDTSDVNIESADGSYKTVASTYWAFGEDGSFTLTNATTGTESTGTYAIEDKTLTITFSADNQQTFPFVIKGDKLSLDEGDNAVVLSRVK